MGRGQTRDDLLILSLLPKMARKRLVVIPVLHKVVLSLETVYTALQKCRREARSELPTLSLPGAEMDLVLSAVDYYFFTPYVYPATWPEDNIIRQTISLLIVTNLGAYILYFFCATLSYYFVYDHSLMKHPQFLKVRDFFSSFRYHQKNVIFVNL